MQKSNRYFFIKDEKFFIINVQKGKSKISQVSSKQANKLIISSKKYVLLFIRENHLEKESMRENESLYGCTKEQRHQIEEFIQSYKVVFQEPKGIPSKKELEHNIKPFPNSPLQNIRLYKQSILEASDVKKQLKKLLYDSTKYLTLWVTHHNCARKGWDLANVHMIIGH